MGPHIKLGIKTVQNPFGWMRRNTKRLLVLQQFRLGLYFFISSVECKFKVYRNANEKLPAA